MSDQDNHSVSYCTLDGRILPMPNQKEDLFEVTHRMIRFVVDSNSFRKREFAKPEYRNRACILTETIIDEQPDLQGLLFGGRTTYENNNVFVMERFFLDGAPPVILLHRLDRYY